MILMIWTAGTPSACEKSRTVTPDGTVTGPVGGDDLARRRLRPVAAAAALPRVARALAAGALDDDAALPSGRSLAGPDRAVGLVRLVCHQWRQHRFT